MSNQRRNPVDLEPRSVRKVTPVHESVIDSIARQALFEAHAAACAARRAVGQLLRRDRRVA